MSKAGDGKMGLWAVVAIGVGGMVGGGIFAVLGLAVQLAHGGTPVAFALAGMVALLTAYSYAKAFRRLSESRRHGQLPGPRVRRRDVHRQPERVAVAELRGDAVAVRVRIRQLRRDVSAAGLAGDRQTRADQSRRDRDCRHEPAQRRVDRQSGDLDRGIKAGDPAVVRRRRCFSASTPPKSRQAHGRRRCSWPQAG